MTVNPRLNLASLPDINFRMNKFYQVLTSVTIVLAAGTNSKQKNAS
jgi:hypothetical protein